MNILTDNLPEFVRVKDAEYRVYTDFRIWLEFDRIMHLSDIDAKDKIMMALCLCFDKSECKVLPMDISDAIDALQTFFLCGKKREPEPLKTERVLDFSEDCNYIYSAFLTQYGIDLMSVPYLHWYTFCALFEGLEEQRKIVEIMRFRAQDPEKVQNPEKKKYLKRMKALYSLPGTFEKCTDEAVAGVLFEAF